MFLFCVLKRTHKHTDSHRTKVSFKDGTNLILFHPWATHTHTHTHTHTQKASQKTQIRPCFCSVPPRTNLGVQLVRASVYVCVCVCVCLYTNVCVCMCVLSQPEQLKRHAPLHLPCVYNTLFLSSSRSHSVPCLRPSLWLHTGSCKYSLLWREVLALTGITSMFHDNAVL